MAFPEIVNFVRQYVYLFSLAAQSLVLTQQDGGIGGIHHYRIAEHDGALERLAVEYRRGRAQELVAFGGIDKGGVDYRIGHGLYSNIWSGVDTYYFYIAKAMTVGGVAGGNGHAVVMRVNQVGVGVDIKQ